MPEVDVGRDLSLHSFKTTRSRWEEWTWSCGVESSIEKCWNVEQKGIPLDPQALEQKLSHIIYSIAVVVDRVLP